MEQFKLIIMSSAKQEAVYGAQGCLIDRTRFSEMHVFVDQKQFICDDIHSLASDFSTALLSGKTTNISRPKHRLEVCHLTLNSDV